MTVEEWYVAAIFGVLHCHVRFSSDVLLGDFSSIFVLLSVFSCSSSIRECRYFLLLSLVFVLGYVLFCYRSCFLIVVCLWCICFPCLFLFCYWLVHALGWLLRWRFLSFLVLRTSLSWVLLFLSHVRRCIRFSVYVAVLF